MTDDVEARVRAALDARAAGITAYDLRPAVPPTLSASRRPVWRRTARALVAAAAVAVVAGLLLPRPAGEPAPQQPAAPASTACPGLDRVILPDGTVVHLQSGAPTTACPEVTVHRADPWWEGWLPQNW